MKLKTKLILKVLTLWFWVVLIVINPSHRDAYIDALISNFGVFVGEMLFREKKKQIKKINLDKSKELESDY